MRRRRAARDFMGVEGCRNSICVESPFCIIFAYVMLIRQCRRTWFHCLISFRHRPSAILLLNVKNTTCYHLAKLTNIWTRLNTFEFDKLWPTPYRTYDHIFYEPSVFGAMQTLKSKVEKPEKHLRKSQHKVCKRCTRPGVDSLCFAAYLAI